MIYGLIIGAALLCTIVLIWVVMRPRWMGLQGKTLWDWITIFAVPATVGIGATVLSLVQVSIQEDRARETALQQYIDRISVLIVDGTSPTEIAVGRAQTAAVLRLVQKDRAGRILLFLGDVGLLQQFNPNLEHVDLSGANLKGMPLAGLDFEGSTLRWGELEDADLSGADFESSDLRGADFKDANLSGASFDRARINGADFDHADLRGATLTHAIGGKARQLSKACIDGKTKLPAGIIIAPAQSTGCQGRAEEDD